MTNKEIMTLLADEMRRQKVVKSHLAKAAGVCQTTVGIVAAGDSWSVRLDAVTKIAECLGLEVIVRKIEC